MKNFNFGENLRTIRNYKNVCQEGMSAGLKISQTSYSRIEASREVPEPQLIHKLAEVLDVRPEYLVSANWYAKALNNGSKKNKRTVFIINRNGQMIYAILLAVAALESTLGAADGAKIESLDARLFLGTLFYLAAFFLYNFTVKKTDLNVEDDTDLF